MLTRRESDTRATVLIAEDDPITRAHLQTLLNGAGYDVVACADGHCVVDAASAFVVDRGGQLHVDRGQPEPAP